MLARVVVAIARARPAGIPAATKPVPMIDVHAASGTFADKPALAKALTAALIKWERVPAIPLFTDNTAAFVHELPADSFATASGKSDYVRVIVLTPAGVLDREKKIGVVKELAEIVAAAAADPSLIERTWVLITEAPDGGWGIGGQAFTDADIGAAARKALAPN